MYLVCWCLQACECCQDCSGQAKTITGWGQTGETLIYFAGRSILPTIWDLGDIQASDLCTRLTRCTGPIISVCFSISGPAFLTACGSFQGDNRCLPHDSHGTLTIRAIKVAVTFFGARYAQTLALKCWAKQLSCCTKKWASWQHFCIDLLTFS